MWKLFLEGHILSTAGDALTTTTSGVQFAQLLLKLVCYSCGGEVEEGVAKEGWDQFFRAFWLFWEEYYILALLVCVCNAIR
jgi:hypothetical protein